MRGRGDPLLPHHPQPPQTPDHSPHRVLSYMRAYCSCCSMNESWHTRIVVVICVTWKMSHASCHSCDMRRVRITAHSCEFVWIRVSHASCHSCECAVWMCRDSRHSLLLLSLSYVNKPPNKHESVFMWLMSHDSCHSCECVMNCVTLYSRT